MFLKVNNEACFNFDWKVRNIGSVDLLGNFCLDHEIKKLVDLPAAGFWDRIKQEYLDRNQEEVKREAFRIIREVFVEVINNCAGRELPECIHSFLSFSCVK